MTNSARHSILALALVFACSLGIADTSHPNILMIAVDDLRPELGCYGAVQIHSPNIDSLAASGMRFERAYCSVAVCGASRASLLSGCRPETTNVWDAHTLLRQKMPGVLTLPGHLAASGYQTASLGKVYHRESDDKESWTIDVNKVVPLKKGTGEVFLNVERYADQFAASTNPKVKPYPATQNGGDVPDNAYSDGANAERAVKLLNRFAVSEQPFFLAVGFKKPHLPFTAPGKYWDLYDRDKIEVPPRVRLKNDIPWARSTWGELKNYLDIGRDKEILDDETSRKLIHGYYAAISYTDAQVGKLLTALRELSLEENTIIVLWGDHGWYLGDYGDWCKHSNYEVATHVPFIIRAPESVLSGAAPGKTKQLAELLDIYPTLCELTGVSTPSHLHGSSLVPLLIDPSSPWREAAISQYIKKEPIYTTSADGKRKRKSHPTLGTSVRTDEFRYTRWKNIKSGEVRAEELIDFEVDPGSTVNVIDDPIYADKLPRLRQLADQSATGVKP